MIEVSPLCNARCKYCAYSQQQDYFYGNMELEIFQRILEELHDFPHPVCKRCMLPNDITNEADILDPWAEEILERF